MTHEFELLSHYLTKLRQERLQRAHHEALKPQPDLLEIKVAAREAELCSRIVTAVQLLDKDAGKFVEEFLP